MGKSLKGKELGRGITQRRDGLYQASFINRFGKRQTLYSKTYNDISKKLREAKYEDDHLLTPARPDMTLDAWFDILISGKIEERHGDLEFSDPTGELAIKRESLIHRIDLVNESAKISGGDIFEYLLKSVAYGYSFKTLQTDGIPCGKDYFYDRYRKYFYILDKLRD